MKYKAVDLFTRTAVSPYTQGFADSKHTGIRTGPIHLFERSVRNAQPATTLCRRKLTCINTGHLPSTTDICVHCTRTAFMNTAVSRSIARALSKPSGWYCILSRELGKV